LWNIFWNYSGNGYSGIINSQNRITYSRIILDLFQNWHNR
jgi:hypothetical protein